MTSKARSLRERMSIDPDAPAPVSEPRRRPVRPDAPAPEQPSLEPSSPGPPAEDAAPVPPATPAPDPGEDARPRRTVPRTATRRAPARRSGRRSARDGVDWESALDDPGIAPGANGYRSFYVSDEVFARFRAAVYWTARRPDAEDVPDNMSAGVEDYMDSVATDLERRYNERGVFPPTPDQIRAHRRRESRS